MTNIAIFCLAIVVSAVAATSSEAPNIGPDSCGQDRLTLGKWFITHGMPSLLEEPVPELVHEVTTDPYENPANPPTDPNKLTGVCGMQWTANIDPASGLKKYKLANFASESDVHNAGFNITHQGHCAACSALQDLGVYIGRNLTALTRNCSIQSFGNAKVLRKCLNDLGFSNMCASIWEFNIKNTRQHCLTPCLKALLEKEPFNKPDGSLNDCLQCDEDKSGPNFKYFSGRTRRNSGIPSEIQRPSESIYNMTHCYWYGKLQ